MNLGGGSSTIKQPLNGYIIIMAGQSNGTSRGNILPINGEKGLNTLLRGSLTGVKSYYKTVDNSVDNGSWVNLQAGVTDYPGSSSGTTFGISITLGNSLLNRYGITPWIIPAAYSSSYIYQDQQYLGTLNTWNINNTDRYTRMYTWNYARAVAAMPAGIYKTIIVWVHGESDSEQVAFANAYKQNVIDFYNKFVSDSGVTPKMIITELKSDVSASLSPQSAIVRQAQQDILAALPNAVYLTTASETWRSGGSEAANIHYSDLSYQSIGNRLADLIVTL